MTTTLQPYKTVTLTVQNLTTLLTALDAAYVVDGNTIRYFNVYDKKITLEIKELYGIPYALKSDGYFITEHSIAEVIEDILSLRYSY